MLAYKENEIGINKIPIRCTPECNTFTHEKSQHHNENPCVAYTHHQHNEKIQINKNIKKAEQILKCDRITHIDVYIGMRKSKVIRTKTKLTNLEMPQDNTH